MGAKKFKKNLKKGGKNQLRQTNSLLGWLECYAEVYNFDGEIICKLKKTD